MDIFEPKIFGKLETEKRDKNDLSPSNSSTDSEYDDKVEDIS